MPGLIQNRVAISGVLLLLMLAATLAAAFFPQISGGKPFWLSGVFAIMAALLLLPDVRLAQRIQLFVLLGSGAVLLAIALSRGVPVDWSIVIAQNTSLLTMVLSVGLLKLLFEGSAFDGRLPTGRRAYLHTLFSLGIFGSVINISAAQLIADRLTRNRPMDYFTSATITRMFCMCSAWSPFFGGTAVVLTMVPGIRLHTVMLGGLPLTMMALVLLYWSATTRYAEKLKTFHGYPVQLNSLWVPVVLAIAVFTGSRLFPSISILAVIALSAILLTVCVMLLQSGISVATNRFGKYVVAELPRSLNELMLFLSAGVLAAGLSAMVQTGLFSVPITQFSSGSAMLLLAIMMLISAVGIHPIIQIAAITPLLSAAEPSPALLGLTYMFAWSLGTCVSPLSGTNLIMQGRYGIIAWRGAVGNWRFSAIMYVIACLLLWVQARIW